MASFRKDSDDLLGAFRAATADMSLSEVEALTTVLGKRMDRQTVNNIRNGVTKAPHPKNKRVMRAVVDHLAGDVPRGTSEPARSETLTDPLEREVLLRVAEELERVAAAFRREAGGDGTPRGATRMPAATLKPRPQNARKRDRPAG